MTIADSQLATTLAGPLMHLIGRKQQEQLPSVIRWFTTCTRHPALAPFVGMPTHTTCRTHQIGSLSDTCCDAVARCVAVQTHGACTLP